MCNEIQLQCPLSPLKAPPPPIKNNNLLIKMNKNWTNIICPNGCQILLKCTCISNQDRKRLTDSQMTTVFRPTFIYMYIHVALAVSQLL